MLRTPGQPPFSAMNSTPAFSNARRIASTVRDCAASGPGNCSRRLIAGNCLRNPAVEAGAAIRGEGGQSARGISRRGAGNPRFAGGENDGSNALTQLAKCQVGRWSVGNLF